MDEDLIISFRIYKSYIVKNNLLIIKHPASI